MRVVPFDEVDPGQPIRIMVKGRPILVTILDGIPYAISDTCPHNGASLAAGVFRDGCITCPAHFWRFSVRDGTKQSGPAISVPTYPCWTEEGWIAIDVPELEPELSMREVLLAHARAGRSVEEGP